MVSKNYIIQKQKVNNHFTKSGIEVFVKDSLNDNTSISSAIDLLFEKVPDILLQNIRKIYVGQYKELNDRSIQAMYKDASIFVTNKQNSTEDLLDDLIHEVAHSVEEVYGNFIYEDQQVEKEFLNKRKDLWLKLKNRGFVCDLELFLNTKYTTEFDMFLYKKVGYDIMRTTTADLFHSPYAATSLREYFANGFEAFFLKEDLSRLKFSSPKLFMKISKLSLMR